MFALFLGLLLAFGAGAQAMGHALEPLAAISPLAATLTGHAAGDGDEAPADHDAGYPHHHAGCHDHGAGLPCVADQPVRRAVTVEVPLEAGFASLTTTDPAGLLRPPRA